MVITSGNKEQRSGVSLDTYEATKLALKLCIHPVPYAYKLASNSRTLKNTTLNSHPQDQARGTASNPG
eukprot:scaffold134563_cov21-Tisochrysis_lutea.AAC.1